MSDVLDRPPTRHRFDVHEYYRMAEVILAVLPDVTTASVSDEP